MWEPFDSSKLYTSVKKYYLACVQCWNLSVIRHCRSGKQSGSSLISHSLVGSLLGTIWLLVFPQIPWLLVSKWNVPNSNAFHSYLSHCKAEKKNLLSLKLCLSWAGRWLPWSLSLLPSNLSNTKDRVWPHFQTPRRRLKIRRLAKNFWRIVGISIPYRKRWCNFHARPTLS